MSLTLKPYSLEELGLLGRSDSEAFDNLTRLAAHTLKTPISLISIIDRPNDRQYFKGQHGTLKEPYQTQHQTPLSHSFCNYVVTHNTVLIVDNAKQDPRVKDNGAIQSLGVMSYIGAPIYDPQRKPIGALCAISGEPRQWTKSDEQVLKLLANCVNDAIRLEASQLSVQSEREHHHLKDTMIRELQHRLNNVFAAIQSMINLSQRNYSLVSDFASDLGQRIRALNHANTASISAQSSGHFLILHMVQDILTQYAEADYDLVLNVDEVKLEAKYATPIGLILNELATNAIKYGAWKKSGRVTLTITRVDVSSQSSVNFSWEETSPASETSHTDTTAEGFGSKLIAISLQQMAATSETRWATDGLKFAFSLPISHQTERAQSSA